MRKHCSITFKIDDYTSTLVDYIYNYFTDFKNKLESYDRKSQYIYLLRQYKLHIQ